VQTRVVRVNVYVDGFNFYGGGRELAGRGTAGWKWLDIRAKAGTIAADEWPNDVPVITRVVYCTARVNPLPTDPEGPKRQES
jgi:hypothetical protein